MHQLPTDVVLTIFSFLDKRSFFSFARSSKKYHELSSSTHLTSLIAQWHNEYFMKRKATEAAQLQKLKEIFNECYSLSETRYYDRSLTGEEFKELKFKYLAFCAYANELKAKKIEGLDAFLQESSQGREYIENDIGKSRLFNWKHSDDAWQELYQKANERENSCTIA